MQQEFESNALISRCLFQKSFENWWNTIWDIFVLRKDIFFIVLEKVYDVDTKSYMNLTWE